MSAKCKVVFLSPRREGLGPSAVLMTRGMHSINYIDYPAGTRLTAAEKKRATKQLMRSCRELSRGLGGDAPKKESYAAYKRRMKRIADRARRTPGFVPYRAAPYERD